MDPQPAMLETTPLLPPQGEGCPTPLAWAEVVESFLKDSNRRVVESTIGTISARSLGSGPPIYFLNGASGDSRLFALTAWLLKDQAECVIVDYPDFAKQVRPLDYIGRTVELLNALRESVRHERITLFGASFGGRVALEWMQADPVGVSRGVVQTPTFGIPWTILERAFLSIGRRMPGRVASLPAWQGIQTRNHRDWFPPFDETRWGFLLEDLGQTQIRDLSVRMRAVGAPLPLAVESIRQPLLIVRTEGEGAGHTRMAEQLQSLLPHARTEWMHTAGHLPFLTHPHRLVKIMKAFLLESSL
jgi:pimeloyl-ACP methyl ester carboxylesterase